MSDRWKYSTVRLRLYPSVLSNYLNNFRYMSSPLIFLNFCLVSHAKSIEVCVILYFLLSVVKKVIKDHDCGVSDRFYPCIIGTWIGTYYVYCSHASLNHRQQDLPEPFIKGKHRNMANSLRNLQHSIQIEKWEMQFPCLLI